MPRRLLAVLLLGAGFTSASAAPTVSDAWIRAMPAGIPAAGYFTLANTTDRPIVLTGAQSPACGSLMLHQSQTTGGMAQMRMVDTVEVPARGTVRFEPGGYHLMCMDPKGLKPGGQVAVTLQFADHSSVTAHFAVRTAAGK